MNVTLQSFYKFKITNILNIVLVVCFSASILKAQMISTYAGIGLFGASATSTTATSVKFKNIGGIVNDASGNLYIIDHDQFKIFKVSPTGIISLFAGNGQPFYNGDGGLATAAAINRPEKIAIDGAGNIYFSSNNTKTVRKINTLGIITTVAGNGTSGFSGDGGLATAAQLHSPQGLAADASGNLYIDDGNYRIRKVDAGTGIITTIAGIGLVGQTGDGGLATAAKVDAVSIDVDVNGNIYLAAYNSVRKINAVTGIITTIAGSNSASGYSGDGGPATAALLGSIFDIKLDNSGDLYITDWTVKHLIRKVNMTTGIISTVAGSGVAGFSGDGGSPIFAKLYYPNAIAFNQLGEMFITDSQNYRIRKVDFLATPICPNALSVSKNRGTNGVAIFTPNVTPVLGTPDYSGTISGNSLTNPLATVSFSTSTSYTQTFPGNGIYNFTLNYNDTISGMYCNRTLNDTILISNSLTSKTFNRRFSISNSYLCNSGNVNFVDSTRFSYSLNNTPSTYTIITNWGNGSTVTNTVIGTNQILVTSASTTFSNPGVYSVQSIIKGNGIVNDTAYNFVYVDECGNVTGTVYNDINNDCSQNMFLGEFGVNNIPVYLTSAINSYVVWTNTGGVYAFNNIPAGTYTISVNAGISGYTVTCANSLPHSTILTGTLTSYNDFALNCTGGFDAATTGISLLNGLFPGQTDMILPHVGLLNGSCNFIVAGQVKMILTPCIQYIPGGSNAHVPDAIIPAATGDTLVWNVADINNVGNFGYWNYAVSITTCTNAVVGDIACITMLVLPTSGDVNVTNNSCTKCFSIGVSYDPNYKEVTPKGSGVQGYIPATANDLTYTLHFQNTGTAKATNIYLIDTISNNLNINSIEIIASSHAMHPYLLPNRTMKFMFAYIDLPDSTSDEPNSHGYITYKIKPNVGLLPGTQIKNTCYIYFDYNSPVVTNTTLNTIEFVTGVNKVDLNNGFMVFPNPAQDKISVYLFTNTASDIMMYDVLGNEVKQLQTNELQSEINVADLVSGVYLIKIVKDGKAFTQKVMIQK